MPLVGLSGWGHKKFSNSTPTESKSTCSQNPTLPECKSKHSQNPTLTESKSTCSQNPTLPECKSKHSQKIQP